MTTITYTGRDAYNVAQRKASYGHRDWLVWTDRAGVNHAARKTPENVKTMLLQTGTQGEWALVCANSGCGLRGFWWMGINMINQMKRGIR